MEVSSYFLFLSLLITNIKTSMIDGISGGLAALLWSLILHPLENIRTRLQDAKTNKIDNLAKANDKILFADSFSSFEYLSDIVKREGIFTFYKGLMSSLVGWVISFGLYFFWYKVFKIVFQMNKENLNSVDIIFVSSIAGAISSLLTTPIWIIQARMWVSTEKKSIINHCEEIFKEGGLKAFWKGTIPGLILVINPVVNFVIYENLRNIVINNYSETPSVASIFTISLIGKFWATFLTYPILTLKTKAFTNKGNEWTRTILLNYIRAEGILALYRGLYTKLFQTLLANAFMMIGLEKIREFVQNNIT